MGKKVGEEERVEGVEEDCRERVLYGEEVGGWGEWEGGCGYGGGGI